MTTTHTLSTAYVDAYNTELEVDLTTALAHEAATRRRRQESRWLRRVVSRTAS